MGGGLIFNYLEAAALFVYVFKAGNVTRGIEQYCIFFFFKEICIKARRTVLKERNRL